MGSMKLDLHTASNNFHGTIENIHKAAFGPSPALYRQVSLCGWRPLGVRVTSNPGLKDSALRCGTGPSPEKRSGIEIYETCDAMTIEVALSYVKEDSLHLSITGKTVIIRGERIMTSHQGATFSYNLRQAPQFQHLIPLPATVKAGGFSAQLKGDVVQIDFAKRRLQ